MIFTNKIKSLQKRSGRIINIIQKEINNIESVNNPIEIETEKINKIISSKTSDLQDLKTCLDTNNKFVTKLKSFLD